MEPCSLFSALSCTGFRSDDCPLFFRAYRFRNRTGSSLRHDWDRLPEVGEERRETTGRRDDLLIPLARKTAYVVLCAVALIVLAQSFGLDITAPLAGAGILGFALAMALSGIRTQPMGMRNDLFLRDLQARTSYRDRRS